MFNGLTEEQGYYTSKSFLPKVTYSLFLKVLLLWIFIYKTNKLWNVGSCSTTIYHALKNMF